MLLAQQSLGTAIMYFLIFSYSSANVGLNKKKQKKTNKHQTPELTIEPVNNLIIEIELKYNFIWKKTSICALSADHLTSTHSKNLVRNM